MEATREIFLANVFLKFIICSAAEILMSHHLSNGMEAIVTSKTAAIKIILTIFSQRLQASEITTDGLYSTRYLVFPKSNLTDQGKSIHSNLTGELRKNF